MEMDKNQTEPDNNLDIAIIGMAGRFPGANNLKEFWDNLKHGVESIHFYPEEEVIASGIHPQQARDRHFVPAAGGIDYENDFDADFFDYTPREAEITDPQQRIALECAWETFEAAGYNPDTYRGRTGVYAGTSLSTYLLTNIAANPKTLASVGLFPAITGCDKDFLATRIAYKLNLQGPAISVQTACSTSLVAVNLACQGLLNYQTDMALAGGVSITPKGRLYQEGFIVAKDGHCRAFDQDAQGAVFGNGVGFVLLKRLADARADGDHIHAIIKGSAVNNDGANKVGYTAPSINGQVEVILEAQALAGINPDTITYIETHGTGTLLGDPIEIAALTQAFRTQSSRKAFCALGSVKTNIGHLETAAGISGLIKAVLAVENGQIPASLNFRTANPKLNLADSPFYVNTLLTDWHPGGIPRRAGISSFGFGGTNAHAIIEEAPIVRTATVSRSWQLLPVSGRVAAARQANLTALGQHLASLPQQHLADIAFTLQEGRKAFRHRAFILAQSSKEAAEILISGQPDRIQHGIPRDGHGRIVFMFSGQGSQYAGMTRGLYDTEPAFQAAFDEAVAAMQPHLNDNLQKIIYPSEIDQAKADDLINQTLFSQPAIFVVEYALAKLWQSWGIAADAMIGHSVGEYVAATLAEVFSLTDAASLICHRARLIQSQPPGAMLAVPLAEAAVMPLLGEDLSLAAVNSPGLCAVAGTFAAVEKLEQDLAKEGIATTRLKVSHPFHSHLLESAAQQFAQICATIPMHPPTKRYIANVTGDWVSAELATSPGYWADHLRHTVRFSKGLTTILAEKPTILLEIGPGQVLTGLVRQHADLVENAAVIHSTRAPRVQRDDSEQILTALGELWLAGATINWPAVHHHSQRQRVPLPTYSFQRQKYWLAPTFLPQSAHSPLADTPAATPLPTIQTQPATADYVAPRDELERTLLALWEEMIGIRGIGINEDFFKIGGHSLLATQLIAEIRRKTATEVKVQALFKAPTIAGLAEEIHKLRQSGPEAHITPIATISRTGRLPLTFHQEMVWDFERRWPGSSRFNGFLNLRLIGQLNTDALHFALDEIIRRHEVLRTNYRQNNTIPEAIIRPASPVPIPCHDCSGLQPASRNRHILAMANTLVRKPFDLTEDIFIRPELIKVSEQEHILLIASHYMAVDGWTVGLVVREFAHHYAAYTKATTNQLAELPFQMVDYAAWQRSEINDAYFATRLPYWRDQLANLPAQQPLPPDRMRGLLPTIQGATCHFSLGQELSQSLKTFCHQQGYTLFNTFLAALNALYYIHSGMDDIVIGTGTGDRPAGTDTMVGALVNMLPLRTRLNGKQNFLTVLANVHTAMVGAFANELPFIPLAERLKINLLRQPLFRTVFILRNPVTSHERAGDLQISLTDPPIDRGVADMDLSLYLQEKHGDFRGMFEYNTNLFNRPSIDDLGDYFICLLEEVLAHPAKPLQEILPPVPHRPMDVRPSQRLLAMLGILKAA